MEAQKETIEEGFRAWYAKDESITKVANAAYDENNTTFVVKFYESLTAFEIGRPKLRRMLEEKPLTAEQVKNRLQAFLRSLQTHMREFGSLTVACCSLTLRRAYIVSKLYDCKSLERDYAAALKIECAKSLAPAMADLITR